MRATARRAAARRTGFPLQASPSAHAARAAASAQRELRAGVGAGTRCPTGVALLAFGLFAAPLAPSVATAVPSLATSRRR